LGEISYLADILKPDFGLVISVNASHLDGLRSVDLIFDEKMSLLNHVKKVGVIPSEDDKFLIYKGENQATKTIYTFGVSEESDFESSEAGIRNSEVTVRNNIEGTETTYKTSIQIPFLVTNVTLAIAVSSLLGVPKEIIESGLQKPIDTKNRMEIVTSGERMIIYDCYNANPSSMKAAVKFWGETREGRPHFAILGDMLELGDESERYHREVGRQIRNSECGMRSYVVGVGELSAFYEPDKHFGNVQELIASKVLVDIPDNAVVLVKGSNGIKLDKIKGLI